MDKGYNKTNILLYNKKLNKVDLHIIFRLIFFLL